MASTTGERTCSECGERVLVVRNITTGSEVVLEAARADGGWFPEADASTGILVATYKAPGLVRVRDGHHAHALRCAQKRAEESGALADSRQRILEATTERMPSMMDAKDVTFLPLLRPAGLRALVGASS